MEWNYTTIMLLTTGLGTASSILYFFSPGFVLKNFAKLDLREEAAVFFARHMGLVVFCIGALIIYSAYNELIRIPVLTIASIEKAGFIFLVLRHRKKDFIKGFFVSAVFDTTCVILYVLSIAKIT